MDKLSVRVGKRIKKEREKHGINANQLAIRLGIGRDAVSRWENGIKLPTLESLRRLCKELGVDSQSLLGF